MVCYLSYAEYEFSTKQDLTISMIDRIAEFPVLLVYLTNINHPSAIYLTTDIPNLFRCSTC